MTIKELMNMLKEYPEETKILIEDYDGGSSELLTDRHITGWWERDIQDSCEDGNEKVMLISLYEGNLK